LSQSDPFVKALYLKICAYHLADLERLLVGFAACMPKPCDSAQ
jgi:hypothetical protein